MPQCIPGLIHHHPISFSSSFCVLWVWIHSGCLILLNNSYRIHLCYNFCRHIIEFPAEFVIMIERSWFIFILFLESLVVFYASSIIIGIIVDLYGCYRTTPLLIEISYIVYFTIKWDSFLANTSLISLIIFYHTFSIIFHFFRMFLVIFWSSSFSSSWWPVIWTCSNTMSLIYRLIILIFSFQLYSFHFY